MNEDFYPYSKYNRSTSIITQTPCSKSQLKNPRANLNKIKQDFSSICFKFIQTNMNEKTTDSDMKSVQRLYYRGLLIMPSRFEIHFFDLPNLSFNNHDKTPELSIHMPCIHMQQIIDEKIIFAYLLDAPGMTIQTDLLVKDSVLLSLVTSYVLANASNPLIIPFFEKCISPNITPNQSAQITLNNFKEMFRRYFSQVFEILCLCFESSELLEDDLKYSQKIFKTDQEHLNINYNNLFFIF